MAEELFNTKKRKYIEDIMAIKPKRKDDESGDTSSFHFDLLPEEELKVHTPEQRHSSP